MKGRWRAAGAGLVVVAVLSLYLGSARPVQTTDTMSSLLAMIQAAAQNEDWERATALNKRLADVWKGERFRIALNHAEQPYNAFELTLSRLNGAIVAQDRATAVTSATVALNSWSHTFERLVPLP